MSHNDNDVIWYESISSTMGENKTGLTLTCRQRYETLATYFCIVSHKRANESSPSMPDLATGNELHCQCTMNANCVLYSWVDYMHI